MGHPAVPLGVGDQQLAVGHEAAGDVLGQLGSVDPDDQLPALRGLGQGRGPGLHVRLGGAADQLGGVHAQRVHADPGDVAAVGHPLPGPVHAGAEYRLAAVHERCPPSAGTGTRRGRRRVCRRGPRGPRRRGASGSSPAAPTGCARSARSSRPGAGRRACAGPGSGGSPGPRPGSGPGPARPRPRPAPRRRPGYRSRYESHSRAKAIPKSGLFGVSNSMWCTNHRVEFATAL